MCHLKKFITVLFTNMMQLETQVQQVRETELYIPPNALLYTIKY